MDIKGLLRELGIDFRQHGESPKVTEGWVGLQCVFCGSQNYNLGVHLATGAVSCWRCGGHNLTELVHAKTGLPWNKARAAAARLDRRSAPVDYERPAGRYEPPAGVGPLLGVHRRYLAGRGFDPDELVERWRIGGIGLAGRHSWRIFLPVLDFGSPASWTTRAVGDRAEPRYLSAPPERELTPLKSLLYGEQHVRGGVVVHEGPADVWATGPGAVGTFGTAVTPAQVRRLSKYAVRAIAFDNEPAAQKRARNLADQLSPFPGETVVVRLSGKDAATTPRTELAELRRRFLE